MLVCYNAVTKPANFLNTVLGKDHWIHSHDATASRHPSPSLSQTADRRDTYATRRCRMRDLDVARLRSMSRIEYKISWRDFVRVLSSVYLFRFSKGISGSLAKRVGQIRWRLIKKKFFLRSSRASNCAFYSWSTDCLGKSFLIVCRATTRSLTPDWLRSKVQVGVQSLPVTQRKDAPPFFPAG